MGTRKFRPTTPSRRFISGSDFAELTKGAKVERSLTVKLTKKAGRNNSGRITVRRRGGGHKRRYRIVDFRRDNYGVVGTVDSIQYDPNRTARPSLLPSHTLTSVRNNTHPRWYEYAQHFSDASQRGTLGRPDLPEVFTGNAFFLCTTCALCARLIIRFPKSVRIST